MTPLERIRKARTTLVLDHPFWGSLALRLTLVEDKNIPTACTDGREMRYNPEFIDKLSDDELTFIVAHELGHNMLEHIIRRGDREPFKWNIACDFAINPVLLDCGFKMPKGGLIDKSLKDMSAEEIYSKIKVQEIKLPNFGGGNGKGNENNPDPGGCGGVEDAKNGKGEKATGAELTQIGQDWKIATAQAAQQAKLMGNMPAGLARLVDELMEPFVDWRELLRRFVQEAQKNDYAWFPPNRKYIHRGLYLPSMKSQDALNVIVGVDTSGSIGQEELNQFASELSSILEEFQAEAKVIYCDAAIANVEDFTSEDMPLELHPAGGGGTDFRPVFKYVAEHSLTPTCLIFFTDLCGTFPTHEPEYPVLWAHIGSWGEGTAPFGEVVELK